ncbi:14522_t:CDS:2, partial [Funneliformis mosseae]
MPPNLRKMSLNNRDYSFKNLKFKRFLHFINNKNKDVIGENHTNTRKFDSENERIINRGFTALFDPNIETEDIKANVLHSVTKKVWGGNFSSPIENRLIKGVRVLDVCCGPGYWVLDMAKTYPKSTFIGMDISPTFSEREKMTNVAFLECNVHDGLPWPNDTFDFVYQRYAWASYNEVQWKNIISEITRVCKPGGMIELMEFDWEFKNNSPIAMNYQKL